MKQIIVNERIVSALHPEWQEWDDQALSQVVEYDEVYRKRRVCQIRFSSGDVYDTKVVSVETREKSIASVDID